MQHSSGFNQKIGRIAERLRDFQRDRDSRIQRAMEMLTKVEEKMRVQRAALDQASTRISQLQEERDAAVARANELVELYESSLSNNDAFFKGIESLANRIVGEAFDPAAAGPASPPAPQSARPAARPAPPVHAPPTPPVHAPPTAAAAVPTPTPAPAPTSLAAPNSGLVHGPAKTPFLKELGPDRLLPRDRVKDGDMGRILHDLYRPKSG